jgi:hypothetical protein
VSEDPFRADAAVVYRHLRDIGPSSVAELAEACFPTPLEGPETSIRALARVGRSRVIDSIVWMRHQKVLVTLVPSSAPVDMGRFHLGAVPIDVRNVYREGSRDTQVAQPVSESHDVTESEDFGGGMDDFVTSESHVTR